jgi:hypothetical protein
MRQFVGRVGLIVVLVVGLGCMLAPPASAQTEEPTTVTTVAASDPTGGPGGASNTPQPVGRLVPTTSQRIADNLAWVWVMAFLVGGGVLAIGLARREDTADPGASMERPMERSGSGRQ